MALKDWKKVELKDIFGWITLWKKNGIEVELFHNKDNRVHIYRQVGYWDGRGDIRTIIDKDFSTKAQALNFAKSYMRAH